MLTTEEFDATLAKTGMNVKRQLEDIFQAFGLDTTHLDNAIFTTDRGSNIISALREEERLDCINHVLNRVVQPSLEEKNAPREICNLLTAVKKLVRYVKKNNLQDLLSKTLKQCNSTCWNSIFYMLKSVLDTYDELHKIFALHKAAEIHRVSKINYNLLKQLTDFLELFSIVTKVFEEEKQPTLHLVIPKMAKLKKHCEVTIQDSPPLKAIKKKASSFITSKFNPHILHKVAVFLNPRQKSMRALNKEDQELVLEYVNERADALSPNFNLVNESSSPPSKKSRYEDEFDDIVEDEPHISEVQAYQKQQLNLSNEDTVLSYWQANEKIFPALSALARKVFSVMATSSASERNFSHAGVVVSARRSCLKSSSVNDVLFLNSGIRAKKNSK